MFKRTTAAGEGGCPSTRPRHLHPHTHGPACPSACVPTEPINATATAKQHTCSVPKTCRQLWERTLTRTKFAIMAVRVSSGAMTTKVRVPAGTEGTGSGTAQHAVLRQARV